MTRYQKDFLHPSRCVQAHRKECDINYIMSKYKVSGALDHFSLSQPRFLDCTSVKSYDEALNLISTSNDFFESLPSEVRKTFDNNLSKFLAFVDANPSYFDKTSSDTEVKKEKVVEPVEVVPD